MTTSAQTAADEKEAEKQRIADRKAEIEQKEKAANADKTGKGLRVFFGFTRGKGSQMIEYENWDETQPDTLPSTLSEFMDLRKMTDEKDILRRILLGDNDVLYEEASDPVAEFVEASWSPDVQRQFKLVVKNYAAATGVSIDDAVKLIKPGIVASQVKT